VLPVLAARCVVGCTQHSSMALSASPPLNNMANCEAAGGKVESRHTSMRRD
jgi:hypothetical protein